MSGNGTDAERFDQDDLLLSPEMHQAQAEIAAERGEDYDPYQFEAKLEEMEDPDIIEDVEPV